MASTSPAGSSLRFITIRFSHYCEKARWALDHAGLAYREESHVPIFSWAATFGAKGRRTVPVLVTPEGTLSDSTDILRWVDGRKAAPPLFPQGALGEEVSQWEDTFDRKVGPAARRLIYFHLMNHCPPEMLKRLLQSAGPPWEARLTGVLFPVLKAMMVRGLRINPEGAERSAKALQEVLDSVAGRLADGRRYLAGEHFTAADLTFASLLVPMLWPERLARTMPLRWEELPASLRAEVERVRATPAGKFALRLYAEERDRQGQAGAAA
jgi:glutathione S-transferase